MEGESEAINRIPIHVRRGYDDESIVYSSMLIVFRAVFIRRYQFFRSMIEVSNIVERGVPKYGL